MTAYKLELLGYQHIEGKIHCLTGLRIGGSSEVIEIGGLDNPVIRHPITREPYIPGSSLKGKMRSLLELFEGKIDGGSGDVCKCGKIDCSVCRLFGVSGAEGSGFGPGRLIVRDAKLHSIEGQPEWQKDLTQTEIKYENNIDRITGTAQHPRQMERVPAGSIFEFSMSFRVFSMQLSEDSEPDNGKQDLELFNTLFTCMRLLEKDTLGGSGSRGYGQIKFNDPLNATYLDGSEKEISLDDSMIERAR